MAHHRVTPVFYSQPLSAQTGQKIYLKMECFQPSLSFKVRGIGRLTDYYVEQGYRSFVASSGGNAGYSAAYITRALQLPLFVFVPHNTHPIYVAKIRSLGATVIMKGDVWDDAHQAALQYATEHHAAYLPPFDHPLIWAGNSTLVDEVVAQMAKPDAIIVAVGGGGLAVGILEGLQRYGWQDIPLFGIEPLGAASLAASLAAGKMVQLAAINTLITTLGTKHVCQRLIDLSASHTIHALQVADAQAVKACRQFLDDHQVLVEPACGAALSVVYEQQPALRAFKSLLVMVCGGVGISPALLAEFTSRAA